MSVLGLFIALLTSSFSISLSKSVSDSSSSSSSLRSWQSSAFTTHHPLVELTSDRESERESRACSQSASFTTSPIESGSPSKVGLATSGTKTVAAALADLQDKYTDLPHSSNACKSDRLAQVSSTDSESRWVPKQNGGVGASTNISVVSFHTWLSNSARSRGSTTRNRKMSPPCTSFRTGGFRVAEFDELADISCPAQRSSMFQRQY
mmetsp:Transcript_25043/g.65660  ORF Transcript_25043/g.65660 Transcript_25043/m.65660 type:complete len:207 (-) Transcript_25043:27-647(-)